MSDIQIIKEAYENVYSNYLKHRGAYLETVEYGTVQEISKAEKEFGLFLNLKIRFDSIISNAPCVQSLLNGVSIKDIAINLHKSKRTIYRKISKEYIFVKDNIEALFVIMGDKMQH